jgi:hypothetical protein
MNRQMLIDTPFAPLLERYQECTVDASSAFVNQVGITLGNMGIVIPFIALFFLFLLHMYQHFSGHHIFVGYTVDEKDAALDALATSLLLAKEHLEVVRRLNPKQVKSRNDNGKKEKKENPTVSKSVLNMDMNSDDEFEEEEEFNGVARIGGMKTAEIGKKGTNTSPPNSESIQPNEIELPNIRPKHTRSSDTTTAKVSKQQKGTEEPVRKQTVLKSEHDRNHEMLCDDLLMELCAEIQSHYYLYSDPEKLFNEIQTLRKQRRLLTLQRKQRRKTGQNQEHMDDRDTVTADIVGEVGIGIMGSSHIPRDTEYDGETLGAEISLVEDPDEDDEETGKKQLNPLHE